MKTNKYIIHSNKEGYVIGFETTYGSSFDFEGQMAYYPDACDGWTKFENGVFVEDEEKKEEILTEIANTEEVLDLKQKLADTDYIFSKELEEITSLSNPLTFVSDIIKILVNYATTYKTVISQRAL